MLSPMSRAPGLVEPPLVFMYTHALVVVIVQRYRTSHSLQSAKSVVGIPLCGVKSMISGAFFMMCTLQITHSISLQTWWTSLWTDYRMDTSLLR